MSRSLSILVVLSATALPVAVQAKSAPPTTWGKPGVSLADYATDATQCADTSYTTRVAIKPQTVRQLAGLSSAQMINLLINSGASDPTSNVLGYVNGFEGYRSENDIARRSNTFGAKYVAVARVDVVDELQAALDRCLTERGYVRIALDSDQVRALGHLKRHSAERTRYLHALGSDAAVIARQRVGSQ